jgi:hypothetical protein
MNCSVVVPVLLTHPSQPLLPFGLDVLTLRLWLGSAEKPTPPPHTTVPAGHVAKAPEEEEPGGALTSPLLTIWYPGG